MTREGKPDCQDQPRYHVNGILPTTPWLFSCENMWKRVKMLSSYFDLFWYRLSTTTTYWHKQTKTLNTCTTLIQCALHVADSQSKGFLLTHPTRVNQAKFANGKSWSSCIQGGMQLKLGQVDFELWTADVFVELPRWWTMWIWIWIPMFPLEIWSFFSVLENGKPWTNEVNAIGGRLNLNNLNNLLTLSCRWSSNIFNATPQQQISLDLNTILKSIQIQGTIDLKPKFPVSLHGHFLKGYITIVRVLGGVRGCQG